MTDIFMTLFKRVRLCAAQPWQ